MGSRVDVALWWRIPKILKSKSVDDGKGYPSFWEWEETVGFLQRHQDMFQIRVDQGSAGASKAQTDHVVVQCGTAEGARWDHFEWIWTKDLVGSEGEAEADGHVVNMGSGSCGCSQGRDSQAPGWSGSATNAEQVGPRRMETPSPGTACAVQARL